MITKERNYVDKNVDLNGYLSFCVPVGVHVHIYVIKRRTMFVGFSASRYIAHCRDLIAKNNSGSWWQ